VERKQKREKGKGKRKLKQDITKERNLVYYVTKYQPSNISDCVIEIETIRVHPVLCILVEI
jgi:hypothetical protein